MKSMVRYEEVASDPTAVWRIATAANHKTDMVQHQRGDFQKVMAGMRDQLNRMEILVQRLVNSQARVVEARNMKDLRQSNLNSTQEIQPMGAPEGNLNSPLTGLSVVATGWEQDQLPNVSVRRIEWENPKDTDEGDFGIPSWLFRLSLPDAIERAKDAVNDNIGWGSFENLRVDKPTPPICTNWSFLKDKMQVGDKVRLKKFKNSCSPKLDFPEFDRGEPLEWNQQSETNFAVVNDPDEAKSDLVQLYKVGRADRRLKSLGLLWNLPPWPDLNFYEVNWMANGMEKDVYNAVTWQSKIYSQQAKSKPFIEAGVKNETVSAASGTPSTDLIASGNNTPQRCFSPTKSGTGTFEYQNNSPGVATPPPEFCYQISMKLMSEPVIIASGQTYEREKLSQFCHVPVANIFSLYDVYTIGHIPLLLWDQKAHVAILKDRSLENIAWEPNLEEWVARATLYDTLRDTVRIAMIGKLQDDTVILKKGHDEESFEFKTDEEEVIDGPEKVIRVWDPGTGSKNMKWQSSPLGVVGGLTFGAVSAAGRDQPEDLALKVESALYSVGVAESFCTGQIDKLSFWLQGTSQDSPVGTDEFMSLKKPTRLVLRVRKPRAVVNITPALSSALLMNELQWIGLIVKPIDYSLKDGILHIDASAGLKIEEISTKLRENCPSCFNVSDYKYYLIVENLERASMTNNHYGREILARDAFSHLTRIPESADLSAICKRFEKRRFYEAVRQLTLQKAQTLDSIAEVINGQIDARSHDTTIAQCEQCYKIVMNALSTLKGVGQSGTQWADQSSGSATALDPTSRSKYSNQLIQLSVQWPDTALHEHLYRMLIKFGLENELLEYGGFDLVAFLQSAVRKHPEEVREVSVVASKGSKWHDLGAPISTIQAKYIELLARYDVLKGEYIAAARSLLKWAEGPCSNAKEAPTLDQRYQYLSSAVLQDKSTDIAADFSRDPIDSNITVYLLEGKIAVFRFQMQIKPELEYMASRLEHIPGSSEFLSEPFPHDNIVADAETAMTAKDKATKQVFPNTQRCFPYWHILKNAQPHLGTVYTFQAYQNMFMKCMQGSESEMELEESWAAMLHEYKLQDNNWLNDLYRFHHRWCSVFNKDTFEGGINSSQWGKVVKVLLRNEFEEDFLCIQSAPVRAIKHITILSRLRNPLQKLLGGGTTNWGRISGGCEATSSMKVLVVEHLLNFTPRPSNLDFHT